MILLIPIDKKDFEEAKIEQICRKNVWILIKMDGGKISKYSFLDNWKDADELIDYLIVKDRDEDVEEFLDEGIDILMAPLQNYIEDIVEAYNFKELHEI